MGCCGTNEEKDDADCPQLKIPDMKDLCEKGIGDPYTWHPTVSNMQQICYVRRLERQHEALQASFFNLSSQLARLQFRIRQIIQAAPYDRDRLIRDLEHTVFKEIEAASQGRAEELPSIEQHNLEMGDIKKKQHLLIQSLRQQIGSFQQATESLTTEYMPNDNDWSKELKPINKEPSNISQVKNEIVGKPSETKSRKSGGSDYFMKSVTASTESCNDSQVEQSESEVRTTSFKELRDMYQKGCTKSA
ncbi:hypothetical protein FF38_07665 [Lucilia cuprina]|uniref:Uncharacterized protein n=1 Tax=Lucilia cuprina TaxID=7375 RepID=A0A0L0BYE4_LUCCU|nr:RUN domain-containing protein 1 [Lucilia cuprina]KNC24294.1 hypothetical protein FF38_07665 [Lucilia cuprina]